MNTYNIKNEEFFSSKIYKDFINENKGIGTLQIRVYAASEAVPIMGVNTVISTNYNNDKIIFYEGKTDDSGLIERVSLPTPKQNLDNLDKPSNRPYEIEISYKNIKALFKVYMYENICTLQNIDITPTLEEIGEYYGS